MIAFSADFLARRDRNVTPATLTGAAGRGLILRRRDAGTAGPLRLTGARRSPAYGIGALEREAAFGS